jgi:dihydroorotate dehydrogenase electron transfer subunit
MRMFFAEIITNKPIADGVMEMRLAAPADVLAEAMPGQFLHVVVGDERFTLPRPISICRIDRGGGRLRLVYKVVGAGTAFFAALGPGDSLRTLGPCGNGFFLEVGDKAVLVGGGVGAPPLLFLAEKLRAERPGIALVAVLGFKSAPFLKDEFSKACDEVFIATDDGSEGFAGSSADFLEKGLASRARTKGLISPGTVLFACGPRPMLKNVASFAASHGMPCQVSVEERMACGVGVCLGCPVKVKSKDGWKYMRVCKDGPVFQAEDLVW